QMRAERQISIGKLVDVEGEGCRDVARAAVGEKARSLASPVIAIDNDAPGQLALNFQIPGLRVPVAIISERSGDAGTDVRQIISVVRGRLNRVRCGKRIVQRV